MSKYLDMYVTHTKEGLDDLSDNLLALEKNPEDPNTINECFRLAHTIKGIAATMAFNNTSDLAHAMESLMDAVRNGKLKITSDLMDILFSCVDSMNSMVDAVKDGRGEPEALSLIGGIEDILEKLPKEAEPEQKATPKKEKAFKAGKRELAPAEQKPAPAAGSKVKDVTIELVQGCDMPSARALVAIKRLEEAGKIIELVPTMDEIEMEKFGGAISARVESAADFDALAQSISSLKGIARVTIDGAAPRAAVRKVEAIAAAQKKPAQEIVSSVRVKMDRLDDLLDSVGELVINKIRLSEISKSEDSPQLAESLRALDRLTSELQYNVLRIRMVPMDIVFSKYPRMVRDLSKQMGKEIELIMVGQEIELDRTVIDKLGDLLVHLLRNSVDHGIEMPEERQKAGKTRTGTIRVFAAQEQNRVMITVEDDGHGIDTDKVRKKALEKGLRTEDELANMSAEDVINILATPGFSTADKVTEVSGRGVGLDAVKAGVESLGGQMTIDTKRGAWTRITIRLPLTLAIILAMLVRVQKDIYAISIDPIIETISVSESDIKTIGGMKVVNFRGEIVPLLYLSQVLGLSEEPLGDKALIVEIGQTRTGVIIEELLGQQEIVVKPLDKYLRKVPYLGGATILGSGEVALILDLHGLSNHAREQMRKISIEDIITKTGGTENG
jgi:two-component system chemotaxis sensor kinase CheA